MPDSRGPLVLVCEHVGTVVCTGASLGPRCARDECGLIFIFLGEKN